MSMRYKLMALLILLAVSVPYIRAEKDTKEFSIYRPKDYEIQVYDEISFEYIKADNSKELYSRLRVLPNGMLTLPILGETKVTDLTAKELKEKLNAELKAYDYRVDMQIFHERGRIIVIGAVRNPGSYQLSDRTSVYDAIGSAGGFTITANKRRVKVIHQYKDGTRESFYINFPDEIFAAYDKGIGEEKYILKEDDIVWVPQSKIKLTVKGLWHLLQIATIGLVTVGVSALATK